MYQLFYKIVIFNITFWRKISVTNFSADHIFWEKFGKQNGHFYCIKSSIHFASILFCKFLHENKVYRKNWVHHDEASGKSFETVISDFIFLKLCHRDFSPQSNVKNHDFIKKLVKFFIFSGHPLVYLIKYNQSTIRAWTNKKDPMHFGAS